LKIKYSKPVILIALAASIAIVAPLAKGTESKKVNIQETTTTLTDVVTTPATTTVAPETTTTTTTPETTTTTTVVIDWEAIAQTAAAQTDEARLTWGQCGEWHDLAISVGWPEEEWPTLSKIIWRESRCTIDAWNGHDAGLTQVNQIHKAWLAEMGWTHPNDMFDPEKNLTFALRLWQTSGWKPWKASSGK
jgi:surface antigen